jgi:hypothetical protein
LVIDQSSAASVCFAGHEHGLDVLGDIQGGGYVLIAATSGWTG